jgi:ribosome-associated protein
MMENILEKEGASWELAYQAFKLACDKKANSPLILQVSAFLDEISYFVICSGDSELHVRSIADGIWENLKKERGVLPYHTEGYSEGSWILLDYYSVIIHVFRDNLRDFYKLEELWQDAPKFCLENVV